MSWNIEDFYRHFKFLAQHNGIDDYIIFELFEKHNQKVPDMGLEFFQIMEKAILNNKRHTSEAIRNHSLWLFYHEYAKFIKEDRNENNHIQLRASFNYKTLLYAYTDISHTLGFDLHAIDELYNGCCEFCDSQKNMKNLTAQQALDAFILVNDNCTRKSGCKCYISIHKRK